MAKIDMRDVYVAQATRGTSAITYASGRYLADAISANLTMNIVSGEFYANGRMKRNPRRVIGATLELNTDTIDETGINLLLGHTTASSEQVFNLDDMPNPVGVGWYTEDTGDETMPDGFFEATVLSYVKFTDSNEQDQTFGGSYSFGTPTMTGNCEAAPDGQYMTKKRFSLATSGARDDAVTWIKTKLGIS